MSFEEIVRGKQAISFLSRTLVERHAFDEIHVLLPDPSSPEPAFIKATSWLYCLYFEAGRVSFSFLCRLGEAHGVVNREASNRHMETVRCLRTELHHNLGFADSDQRTRLAAENWRRRACGTALPNNSEQWTKCYDCLVGEARDFLTGIEAVLRKLESDPAAVERHCLDWRKRLERDWPAATFDPIVDDVKYRLGREQLNTVLFRNKHLENWKKQLESLEDGFDFNFEATRLVERTFLNDDSIILPITGVDLITTLGVERGPQVGKLLEEARRHFEVNPCTKAELLDHLRDYLDQFAKKSQS